MRVLTSKLPQPATAPKEGERDSGRRWANYDTEGRFFLLEPDVSYRLWRELRLGLIADVVQEGAPTSFPYFDLTRHEDRVGLQAQ